MAHPLDRPVWSALNTGWAPLARGDARALQLDPDFGPFAATAKLEDPRPLAAFAQGDDGLWLTELVPVEPPTGLIVERVAPVAQMVAEHITVGEAAFDIVQLTEVDAVEMRALAHLTKPGPFASSTHRLSPFLGVKKDGRLVAMAGERMQLTGYAEVSGVCTLPEHRGKGYAAGLMLSVMHRIAARGETPFLHAYAANTGAIALYQTLGFAARCEMILSVLRRG